MISIQDKIYGELVFNDVLEKIIKCSIFQRLKGIDQGGVINLVYPNIKISRFEHSIGVAHITRTLGGSIEEQAASLLHDIGHTAFSHVIDYALDNRNEDYHETIKHKFMSDSELVTIANKYNLNLMAVFNEKNWKRLEASLPFLCADRIDYTIRDLYSWGYISQDEAKRLAGSFIFKNEIIYYQDNASKKHFEYLFNELLVKKIFGDSKGAFANILFSNIIKEAISKNYLSKDDFLKDDESVLKKLISSGLFSKEIFVKEVENNHSSSSVTSFKKRFLDAPFI